MIKPVITSTNQTWRYFPVMWKGSFSCASPVSFLDILRSVIYDLQFMNGKPLPLSQNSYALASHYERDILCLLFFLKITSASPPPLPFWLGRRQTLLTCSKDLLSCADTKRSLPVYCPQHLLSAF